jgi:hypothetical protein
MLRRAGMTVTLLLCTSVRKLLSLLLLLRPPKQVRLSTVVDIGVDAINTPGLKSPRPADVDVGVDAINTPGPRSPGPADVDVGVDAINIPRGPRRPPPADDDVPRSPACSCCRITPLHSSTKGFLMYATARSKSHQLIANKWKLTREAPYRLLRPAPLANHKEEVATRKRRSTRHH